LAQIVSGSWPLVDMMNLAKTGRVRRNRNWMGLKQGFGAEDPVLESRFAVKNTQNWPERRFWGSMEPIFRRSDKRVPENHLPLPTTAGPWPIPGAVAMKGAYYDQRLQPPLKRIVFWIMCALEEICNREGPPGAGLLGAVVLPYKLCGGSGRKPTRPCPAEAPRAPEERSRNEK